MKNKIDKPFFEKFNSSSLFFKSKEEIYHSIVSEIGNILASRLKMKDEVLTLCENPFSYGVRDFQSIDGSEKALQQFMQLCRKMILKNEPRISNIEIEKVRMDKEQQKILLEATIFVGDNSFETNLAVKG